MNSEQEDLIQECASAYLFNLVFIANEEDEGGFDHPLEAKYHGFSSLVDKMLSEGVLSIEDYEENGESGQELVPGPNSDHHLKKLIETSNSFEGKECEGVEALRQAFYLKMDSGELANIDESNGPWYQQLVSLDFYQAMAPQPKSPKSEVTPQTTTGSFEAPVVSASPSAIEIQRPDLAPSDLPTKTYLFKKPAFIWLGVTAVCFLISKGSGLFLYLSFIPALLTIFYGSRKVMIGPDGVTLSSLLGSTHIPLDEVEETDLLEEDQAPESITITGRSGDSIKISKWSDDIKGLLQLLKNLLKERS
jgi:hypothetical protein